MGDSATKNDLVCKALREISVDIRRIVPQEEVGSADIRVIPKIPSEFTSVDLSEDDIIDKQDVYILRKASKDFEYIRSLSDYMCQGEVPKTRIRAVMARIHFRDESREFVNWKVFTGDLDMAKVRRRIEDHLRRNAFAEDLLTLAAHYGLRIEPDSEKNAKKMSQPMEVVAS